MKAVLVQRPLRRRVLGVSTLAGGPLQLLVLLLKSGRRFHAIPPAVIDGIPADIGPVPAAGQLNALTDTKAPGAAEAATTPRPPTTKELTICSNSLPVRVHGQRIP
ncbi:hypothetical protein [Streptomyces sp. NPDC056707]|uniref:hypothetical protein n=1 Tax=Streptomyces sp. NPDC056707 TaxID=3345919 RepID=UPI00367A2E38